MWVPCMILKAWDYCGLQLERVWKGWEWASYGGGKSPVDDAI